MRQRWQQLSPRWKWLIGIVLTFSLILLIFGVIIYRELLTTEDLMYEEYEPSVVEIPTVDVPEDELRILSKLKNQLSSCYLA